MPRRLRLLWLAAVFLAASVGAYGQATGTPAQSATPDSSYGPDTAYGPPTGYPVDRGTLPPDIPQDTNAPLNSNPRTAPSNADIPGALSATQILDVLQERPEVIVELKSLLADQLQQQGAQIQADDITDQMLYSQIEASASLRAQITTFLRARGYVTADDLQTETPRVAGSELPQDERSAPTPELLAAEPNGRFGNDAGDATGLFATENGAAVSASDRRDLTQRATPSTRKTTETMEKPRAPSVNASTDEPKVLRSPAPYNLQSMRDLYTQIPEQTEALKRFGTEVFVHHEALPGTRGESAVERGEAGRDTPLDVPLGPDYIVGPGDTLTISLWGGVTQSFTRAVDRDGRILLPEAGSTDVAGLPLGRVQSLIEGALRPQFRNAQIAVTVSQLRSVRVYVVGDVQRPGGFDISALATPLSALLAAGGPTAAGSLRTLRHFRGKTLVEEIDLYDFLLHGLRQESARFESGDTLLVPPVGPLVALSGAVRRPAIYEVKNGEDTLASLVNDAGGLTAAASLSHITIERIDARGQRETVSVDLAAGKDSKDSRDLKDSLPDKDALARFAVKDGDRIRIAPILPYSEHAVYLEGHVVRPGRQPYREGMRLSDVLRSYQDMLPEPAAHGEIVRLVPPDLHAETIPFDVPEVLVGNANVNLQPFDTIRIFGRYEADAPKVTVHGEVRRPGTYPLSQGMTAAQLVRMAGGFKSDALLEKADLTSYTINAGTGVVGSVATVHIGAAVAGSDPGADVPLKRGDILTIHQITGWNDIGEAVTLVGQVAFPGSYGFQEGERLSSVLRRAGGFRETAYPAGAVLVRVSVRELEQKSREELIRQIETSSAAARLAPNLAPGDSGSTLQLIQTQQDQVLARLKSQPPSGRLVVHLTADIDSWANTPADIELRRGDVLTVPKRPGFVLVTGQVYNATALTFTPGKTAGWYLSNAGGANTTANRKDIFIIRANGSVIGRHSGGWFDANVLSTKLDPGDVVVVPQKVIGGSLFWRNLLTTAQLASSIAITAAVASL